VRTLIGLVTVVLLGACSNTEPGSSPDSPQTTTTEAAATHTSAEATPTGAASGAIGEIVFQRFDQSQDSTLVYTVSPDGGQVQQLFPEEAQGPRWSPDGTEIALFCCEDGMAAHIADTGDLRTLPPPDPALETYCGGPWSPDGARLTCESFGVDDPSLNGIHSINSSDGGDLMRITSAPGMDDLPGDYSPDGNQLVFMRSDTDGPIGMS